jgi:O-antigen/teichoic acid export membrane protein
LAVFLTRFIARGGNFFVLAILARTLSVGEMGFYGFASTTAYLVIYFASFGFRHASAYYVGRELDEQGNIITALGIAWIGLAFVATSATVAGYRWYGRAEGFEEYALVAGISVAPMLFWYLGQGIFLGNTQFRAVNITDLIPRYSLLALIAVPAFVGALSLRGAFIASFVGHAMAAGFVAWRLAPKAGLSWRRAFALLPAMCRQGFPFAIALAFVTLTPAVNVYGANLLLGAHAGGLLFGALKLTDIVAEAATATGIVSFAHGVRSQDVRIGLRRSIRAAWAVSAGGLLCGVVMAAASPLIVTLGLGKAYEGAVGLLVVLALGLPFLCFARILNPALAAQGYATAGAKLQGVGVLVNALLIGALVKPLGLFGVAVALSLVRFLVALAYARLCGRILGSGTKSVLIPSRAEMTKATSKASALVTSSFKRLSFLSGRSA